jgi:hypothetical protein
MDVSAEDAARKEDNKRCSQDWAGCARKLALEAVLIVLALASVRVLLHPEEDPINWTRSALFSVLYIVLGMVFKLCDTQFSDRVASISGIEIGLKMLKAL